LVTSAKSDSQTANLLQKYLSQNNKDKMKNTYTSKEFAKENDFYSKNIQAANRNT
jgi:hypothetical protein